MRVYSAFVVIPSLRINTIYYGWRFAAYLAMVSTVSAVGAGIIMHTLFWLLGLIPEPKAGRVEELARFAIDYTFFLNLAALALTGVLVWLGMRGSGQSARGVSEP